MQLLLERKQGRSWTGLPIFKLWAKFDLTSEENELIEKYRVWRHLLTEGNFRRDFSRALLWTIPITLVLSFFITRESGLTPATLILSLALFLIILHAIYQQIRERIYVNDVLKGRTCKCRSVVKLAAKEQTITNLSIIFIRLLEAMKTWGGQEIIEFDPQNLPTVHLIERYDASA